MTTNSQPDALAREAMQTALDLLEKLRTSGHWPKAVCAASDAITVAGKLRHAIRTLALNSAQGSEGESLLIGRFIATYEDAAEGVCMDADTAQELARAFKRMRSDLTSAGEALADLLSWFPDKPSDPEWRIKGGNQGADDAVSHARAALASLNPTPEDEA